MITNTGRYTIKHELFHCTQNHQRRLEMPEDVMEQGRGAGIWKILKAEVTLWTAWDGLST